MRTAAIIALGAGFLLVLAWLVALAAIAGRGAPPRSEVRASTGLSWVHLAGGVGCLLVFGALWFEELSAYATGARDTLDLWVAGWSAALALVGMSAIWENLSPGSLSIGRVVTVLVGLLFAFLGNILPTVRHNYFVGVRTPWTLADPRVWDRANRLAGRLFFAGGLAMVLLALALPERWLLWAVLAIAAGVALPPVVLSYVWFRARTE